MALVRSNDQYTLVEFAIESTYGTRPATYNSTSFTRFPFAGEDLHYEQDTVPPSEEFTAFGGITSVDVGKRVVRGSISIEPSYEAIWFWKLFGNAFAYENKLADLSILGATVTNPTTSNLHVFNNGQILSSYTINVWKAGVGPIDGSHFIDQIVGAKVTSWTWDQPENNRAKITMNFVAKTLTTIASNDSYFSGGPMTQESPYKKVKSTDLLSTRPSARLYMGNGSADPQPINLTSFTITCDKKVDDTSPPFLPSVTTAGEPSIEGNREVTVSITSNLETDYSGVHKPFSLFNSLVSQTAVIVYDSGDAISTTPASNYAIRIDMPSIKWLEMRNNVTGPGVAQLTGNGMCELASTARLQALDNLTGLTAKTIDVRFATHTLFADEPGAADSKFTGLGDQP